MTASEISPSLDISRELALFKTRLLKNYGIICRINRGYVLTNEGYRLMQFFEALSSLGLNYTAIYDVLSCRWMMNILLYLSTGPKRWNKLLSGLRSISAKVLSEKLEKLASYGILERIVCDQKPPAVYYELTERGKALANWLNKNYNRNNDRSLLDT